MVIKSKNKAILTHFSLERCKNGIVFINSIPIFANAENVAKQLQCEIWLESEVKGNPRQYIV
jgi:hypothetical protein